MFKSRKALSPVIASVILIAVTIAVAIAVAAWMGALSIGFMGSSSVTITKVDFVKDTAGAPTENITLTVKNIGTKTVTIATVKVNNVEVNTNATLTLNPGKSGGILLTLDAEWVAGNPYKFDLYDGSGQIIGSYQETAPS
jgi:flagellin-like protein